MAVIPFVAKPPRTGRPHRPMAPSSGQIPVGAKRARVPEPPPPPPLPKLHVNVSPGSAMRLLSTLALAVALCATLGTAFELAAGSAPAGWNGWLSLGASGSLTSWLVSLPWLLLAIVLLAISRVERLVRPATAAPWSVLAIVAFGLAAWTVAAGRALPASPWIRLAALGAVALAMLIACRRFLAPESLDLRVRIAGGVAGGLAAAVGPFVLLGAALLPLNEQGPVLPLLLASCDALAALVSATFAVHAGLIYVRDALPDFSIALDTADEPAVPLTVGMSTARR